MSHPPSRPHGRPARRRRLARRPGGVLVTALAPIAVGIVSFGIPADVPAQPLAAVATGARPGSSSPAAHEAARDAQAGFERRRRSLLPATWRQASRCDETIGRYCYWYDENGPAGPREPERIVAARGRLIRTLDSAAAADPSDALVTGQRVRYLLEDGAHERALEAGTQCAAAAWWCQALRGWAHHAAGRPPDAEAAYDSALAAMPEAERCRWSDLSTLLAGEDHERYRKLACDEREAFERRFWWLATPFFTRGGNERRNEHLARRTFARIAAESPTAYQTRWSGDMEEVLLRYGWAHRWSRREPTPGLPAREGGVVGHEPSPAFRWTPDAHLVHDSFGRGPDGEVVWEPRDRDARERLSLPFVRHLVELQPETALFRRGDSLLAVAWIRSPDTLPLRSAPAALVAAHEGAPAVVEPFGGESDAGGRFATALVPALPHALGVEMFGDSGVVGWGRRFFAPASRRSGALEVSGLLPHSGADGAAETVNDAARRALPDGQARAGAALGIYWEVYGLPDDAPGEAEITVTVTGGRAGLAERVWHRLRGREPATPVHMRWTDRLMSRDGVAARSVTIRIPDLEPGRYTLMLAVRSVDGRTATAERWLAVVR